MGVLETQIAWFISPIGIGILVGGAFLIGSGLLGRIVLFVERELQIRSTRRRRTNLESAAFLVANADAVAEKRRAA